MISKEESDMFGKLFRLTRGAWGYLLLKVLMNLLVTGSYVTQALMAAKVIACVFSAVPLYDYVFPLTLIAAMMALRVVLLWGTETYGKIAAAKIKEHIRVKLFKHLFKLGPAYMNEERTGKLQSIFTDGVEAMEVFLVDYIPQLVVTAFGVLALLGFVLSLDTVVGAIVLAGVLLTLIIPLFGDFLTAKIAGNHWDAYGNLGAQFIDALQGMTTLKVFNASENKARELDGDSSLLFRQSMKRLKFELSSSALMGLATAAGTSLSVGIGAWRVASGFLDPAELFVILFLAAECFRPLNDLTAFHHQSFLGVSAANRMFDFLEAVPAVSDSGTEQFTRKLDAPPALSLRDVSFSYLDGSRPALHEVNFGIPAGSNAAFAGKSGAGKSTIVNLLLRFFDPQTGAILIDGTDIRSYDIEGWRKQIAVVFQDTYLFYGTVSENLRLAKPSAAQQELERVAILAGANSFISALPNGYETLIGERGARLSGGERQRIAIARAILKDAPILIFDEATSNVDAASERVILEELSQLMKKRTTLVIAHRLSTIQNAAQIFVMVDGRIVERGTAEALWQHGGVYSELVHAQKIQEDTAI
jgi:ATP-binding cassette subfamily B protein